MMDNIFLPLRRYAEFHGRSGRLEFWSYTLASLLALVALSTALGMLGALLSGPNNSSNFVNQVFQLIVLAFWVGLLLPQFAVTVRRLHDQGRSGWFLLLVLVPLLGSLLLLILLVLPGEENSNSYGMPYIGH